jgi:hypothetical protein
LIRCIGRGSYGEVWLARSALGSLRAVKVVLRSAFDSLRPYEREFAGIQKFEPVSRSHGGLIDILHVGRNDREGFFYYVMELADGSGPPEPYVPRTLARDFAERTRLPADECVRLLAALASALAHLHRAGLVHRDIKPANIIFVGGSPLLADIGLVAEVTEARSFVGTEGYIPPEGPGAPQADLFSLGKVFYEASTGRDRTEYPSLPDDLESLPDRRLWLELNAVITRLCAADPKTRYPDADELLKDLERLQRGVSIRRRREWETWRRRLPLALGGVSLALVAGWFVVQGDASRIVEHLHRLRSERDSLSAELLLEAQQALGRGTATARFEALETLSKAAEIHPSVELRNEALLALLTPGLREVGRFPETPRPAEKVEADPDHDQFARSTEAGDLVFQRLSTREELCRVSQDPKPVAAFSGFSPDGHNIAVVTSEGTLRLQCAVPGCGKWELGGLGVLAHGLARYSLDGASVAYPQEARRLRIANAADIFKHVDFVTDADLESFAWSPDQSRLACLEQGGRRLLFASSTTGARLETLAFPEPIRCFAWPITGTDLVVATSRGLWKASPAVGTEVQLATLESPPLAISADRSDQTAVILFAGHLELWDLTKALPLLSRPATGRRVDASASLDRIVLYNDERTQMTVLEGATGSDLSEVQGESSTNAWVNASSDGRWTVGRTGSEWAVKDERMTAAPLLTFGEAEVVQVGILPGSAALALRSADGKIRAISLLRLTEQFRRLGLFP